MGTRVKLPAAMEGKRIHCNPSKAGAAHIASEQEEQEEKKIFHESKMVQKISRQLLNKQNIFV